MIINLHIKQSDICPDPVIVHAGTVTKQNHQNTLMVLTCFIQLLKFQSNYVLQSS